MIGSRLVSPKKVFVEMSEYVDLYGTPEPADIRSKDIDGSGNLLEGVIMLAPGEKKGHHHIEDYVDTRIEKVDKLADNDNEVVEGQLEKAQHAMVGKLHDKLKHTPKTRMDDVLMRLAGLHRRGDDGEEGPGSGSESVGSESSSRSGLGEPMNDALAHLGIKKPASGQAMARGGARPSVPAGSAKKGGGASPCLQAAGKRATGD